MKYIMPAEWERHEGTWLQWPHENPQTAKKNYREKLENIWIAMTKELHVGERVHIVVCSDVEQAHVTSELQKAGVELSKVDFMVSDTDDVWIRDNGPIFVKDSIGQSKLTDWKFNGWGGKFPSAKDAKIPEAISKKLGVEKLDMKVCLEGGGIEVNGKGTLIAAKSSIINENRNLGLTQTEIEDEMGKYLGITNFVWIDGLRSEENHGEVTDFHIDGAAKFVSENTVLYEYELYDEGQEEISKILEKHHRQMREAADEEGNPLRLIPLPVTKRVVEQAGVKGTYLNYYIGNEVILVPIYNDEHDSLALKIIEGFFPTKRVVGIDVCELFAFGGMIHCVTQQQPE